HDPDRVSRDISVWPAGKFDREGIPADVYPQLFHRDFGKLHDAGRGNPILLMVYSDLFTGYQPYPQHIAPGFREPGYCLDHSVLQILIRAQFDGFILPIVVDNLGMECDPVLCHENIEKGIGYPVLELEQPPLFKPLFIAATIRYIQNGHQLGTALINILVLEVLGVSKNEVLPEKAVGIRDELVLAARDHGSPATAGNIREPDVITETEAAEKEGDPEGLRGRKISGCFRSQLFQISRIEPESQGLFFQHKEIGLQRVGNEGETTAENGAANFVQMTVAGIVFGNGLPGSGKSKRIGLFAINERRIESGPEQPGELQGYFGMGMESALDIIETEAVRLVVGQVAVAECDEGIHKDSILASHQPGGDQLPIAVGTRRQYLGRGEFTPQPGELLTTLVQPPPITLPHIEGTEKIGMYAVADGQAVRSPYAKIQPVEHLHYLKEKVALGWIADCEQHPVL